MIRPVKLGLASLKGLGAVVVLGAVAHAGMPYLPLIGPPPLRVQAVKSPAAAPVKYEATPALAATNPPVAVEAKDSPAMTNATSLTSPVAAPPLLPESPDGSLGDTFASSVLAMPTPDLLGITPQMLATYFHPVRMGTNCAAPAGPFQVIFMPPLPPPPPDKSSHAEYIVK
jgi:hypothetical protein